MRIWVRNATGLLMRGQGESRYFGRPGHVFYDRTERPMMPVQTTPTDIVIEKTPAAASLAADKPPYRVPTMKEVRRIKPNGFSVISTFSGCGGSSLGYRMAGFRVLWVNEFVEAARDSYRANARKETIIDGRDIRTVDPLEILKELGLKPGELDLLDGSPPCASFSTAGKRQKDWGKSKKYSDREQRSDDLFFEFVRFVKAIQPKVFVAENVSGLVKGVAKGYFIQILAALKACGYVVEAKLLDAQWLGVPQQRQRIIFIGVRNDLKAKPAFPTPLPYRYSIREALPWLDSVVHDTSGLYGAGEVADRPSPAVTVGVNSVNSNHLKVRGTMVQGPEVDQRNKGKAIDVSRPAPAVVAGNASKRTPRQFEVVIQPGKQAGRRRKQNGRAFEKDAPAPTIMGQTPGQFEVVIHPGQQAAQRRRKSGRPYSADEPAPAILAETGKHSSTQFQIEQKPAVIYRGQKGGAKFGERRRSLDLPSANVSAVGYGAAAAHQAFVETPHVEPESDISRFKIGREWDKLKPGQQTYFGGNLSRPHPDKPALTVTAVGGTSSASAITHPFERRKFSIAELRRLCAFPDDFILTGTYGQQWERLGRAVPPLMMFSVARVIRDEILIPARNGSASDGRKVKENKRSGSSPRKVEATTKRVSSIRRTAEGQVS